MSGKINIFSDLYALDPPLTFDNWLMTHYLPKKAAALLQTYQHSSHAADTTGIYLAPRMALQRQHVLSYTLISDSVETLLGISPVSLPDLSGLL